MEPLLAPAVGTPLLQRLRACHFRTCFSDRLLAAHVLRVMQVAVPHVAWSSCRDVVHRRADMQMRVQMLFVVQEH